MLTSEVQVRALVSVTSTTLHPAPYTLHPTPYTLRPTPYTLCEDRVWDGPASGGKGFQG